MFILWLGAWHPNSDLDSIFCIIIIRNCHHHCWSGIIMPIFKFTLWQMDVIREGGLEELLASLGLRKVKLLVRKCNCCQPRLQNTWFPQNKKFRFGNHAYKVPMEILILPDAQGRGVKCRPRLRTTNKQVLHKTIEWITLRTCVLEEQWLKDETQGTATVYDHSRKEDPRS